MKREDLTRLVTIVTTSASGNNLVMQIFGILENEKSLPKKYENSSHS